MGNGLSIFSLIVGSGAVVQAIMFILVLMSVYSWTLIFSKNKILADSKKDLKKYANFPNTDLQKSYADLKSADFSHSPMMQIFIQGYAEFNQPESTSNQDLIANSERAYRRMNVVANTQIDRLDEDLSVLAMIASSSPYIGLFGTVWGIMHSFIGLASVKHASIAIVAPGIAEALIATAFGLFAAIPATIAYNRLTASVLFINNEYTTFTEKLFISLQK